MEISEEQKNVIRDLVANMVRVDGGTFLMGAQSTDAQGNNYDTDAQDNECPVHEVLLNDYYIGKFEITQREWAVIMGHNLGWSDLYGNIQPYKRVCRSEAYGTIWLNLLSGINRTDIRFLVTVIILISSCLKIKH